VTTKHCVDGHFCFHISASKEKVELKLVDEKAESKLYRLSLHRDEVDEVVKLLPVEEGITLKNVRMEAARKVELELRSSNIDIEELIE
jgi:hypothetical protein